MSEETPDTAAYDPALDTDSDPETLNPREGAAARNEDADGSEEHLDPDADPDNLNPRA